MLLGCIADDLTGATDLALVLVHEGMRTVQIVGVPDESTPLPDADAVVIALKSRTIPAHEAIDQSVQCSRWLKDAGAQQIFFKYCSTFDSTDEGNIGPVTDALLKELNGLYTIACPAFPQNGRTVFQGNLFVYHQLLSESSLRNHPLTPMHDSNLNRVLRAQSKSQIENIFYQEVDKGHRSITEIFQKTDTRKPTIFITDAINDDHLRHIGTACEGLPLVTGGSAIAQGLPDNFRSKGLLAPKTTAQDFRPPIGRKAILSGSCSDMTLAQVEFAKERLAHFKIDVKDIISGKAVEHAVADFANSQKDQYAPILIYSTAQPADISRVQSEHGKMETGALIEKTMGNIAKTLRDHGFNQFVVAGGETSGAVINGLTIKTLNIGPEIDPGVPWTITTGTEAAALALKSGNFGTKDFFIKAFNMLAPMPEVLAND